MSSCLHEQCVHPGPAPPLPPPPPPPSRLPLCTAPQVCPPPPIAPPLQALVPEERESCLNWFEDARSYTAKGFVAFSDDVTARIYQDKLLTLEPRTLTPAAFRVFQTFFLYVNLRTGKLDLRTADDDDAEDSSTSAALYPATPATPGRPPVGRARGAKKRPPKAWLEAAPLRLAELREEGLWVVEPDLLGLDRLWRIVCECEDRPVGSAAIRFLNRLRLGAGTADDTELRRAHIDDCHKVSPVPPPPPTPRRRRRRSALGHEYRRVTWRTIPPPPASAL